MGKLSLASILDPALGALTGIANAGVSLYEGKVNREHASNEAQYNRDFQLQMYERQLDDNIAWRTHQEQYNSPEAQMQRYRDAGINPMFAVTGNGGNMVTTPMQVNGSGYGSSVSAPGRSFQPMDAVSISQARALNAQANMYQADADAKAVETKHKLFEYAVDDILQGLQINGMSYHAFRASVVSDALEYQKQTQGMDFNEKKKVFDHAEIMRGLEQKLKGKDLDKAEQAINLLKQQVSKAENEAEVAKVAKEWAKANQWINASTDVLGAVLGIFGLAKGTSLMPFVTNSQTPHVNERHYYGDTNNNIFNN